MSNWADATLQTCRKCGAEDRPGATIIEVTQGVAVCGVCAFSWKVTNEYRTPPGARD